MVEATSAMPTATTVSQNQRKILTNRLRIQVSRPANAFYALAAILKPPDFFAEIADMRVDAAVEWREFTAEDDLNQLFAAQGGTGNLHEASEQIKLDGRKF